MTRVKLLMALHKVHPQLTNVNLVGSYDLEGYQTSMFSTPNFHLEGPMPMLLFVLILEGKAKMKQTSFTLPSNDDVEQAPADLKQRVQAIESVDLSSKFRLTGNGNQFPIYELPL